MRTPLILVLLFCVVPGASAQSRDAVTIESIRVGFASSARTQSARAVDQLAKDGFWTPVYVTVKCLQPFPGPGVLTVIAADSDEIPTRYSVAVPQLTPGQSELVTAYTRPGSRRDSIRVSMTDANGRELTPEANQLNQGLSAAQFVFLSIGSQLDASQFPGTSMEPGAAAVRGATDARSLLGVVSRIEEMPTRWFGYDGVDLVVLNTSDREFASALVGERDGRKAALVEWVRRGGRLVVSLGINQDLLAGLAELADAIPVTTTGSADVDVPRIAWTGGLASDEPLGRIVAATLAPRPGRSLQPLLAAKDRPLVVRGGYGFGRVTVVAFDLDGRALSQWKNRDVFWRELGNRAGVRVPNVEMETVGGFGRFGDLHPEDREFATVVQLMERFPEVPVIPFGWVALFILGYIILVGPLDYLFLKKVVKRLEFTWITFPIIVVTVSAIAYFAAYALKGGDLRINKIDLVDIDARHQLVQGRTWFTLFSPRIQNYRLGLDYAWSGSGQSSEFVMSWAGLPRQSRQSLFPRSYDYLPRATGLDNVPVQVWSTKGFQGEWLAPFDAGKPLAISDLRVPPGGRGLTGEIRLNLPAPLENAFLIYSGGQREPVVRSLGTVLPGAAKPVTAAEPRPFKNWVGDPFARDRDPTAEDAGAPRPPSPNWMPISLFFHELQLAGNERPANASLRALDQSWRLEQGSDAILIGTLGSLNGPAESIATDPSNPSLLWLGAFPGGGGQRPPLPGLLRQDTCVRIFLPVRQPTDSPRN
jgi:hypothetical protein